MAFVGSGYTKLHLLTQLKTHMVYLIVLVGLCGTCSYSKEVLRLGYLTGSSKGTDDLFYDKPGQSISGAITLAVDEVNNSTEILPNHELQFIIAETHGEALRSIRQSVVLMDRNISAYIGPQETCLHEARLAAAFNLPMISYFCTNHEVSDKNQFPTFARTKPHDSQISKALVALMKHYNWNKLVFIHTDTKYELAETIQQVLAENDIAVTESHSFDGPYFGDTVITESPFIEIVQETYQKTRVYVMLADFYEFEGLLIALKLRGLIDTGEYIVIGVDSKQYDLSDPQKYIQGLLRKEESPQVTAAFQGFLLIAPAAPVYPWFENFTRIVNYYLEAPPFNFKNPFKDRNVLKILRAEAAYLYDAVWIYARAADRAIREGQQPSDGRAIYSYIQGTTYESAMGYMNHIDVNGDSEGNFTLLARKPGDDPDRGYGLYPVGTFLLNQNTSIPNLQLKDGETVEWIGGEAPLDEPPCGFVGEFCIPVPGYTKQIVGGTLGGLLVLVNIVAVIAYRTWRYEQELASLMWKIDPRDVVVTSHTSQYSGSSIGIARMGSALRASMISLTSQADLDLRQVFTQVGTYRGSIVALKPILRKNIDLSREVRKELKMVRDIRHDNLNQFIGASIDPGNMFIISEYCSKGSLQDILENDDYKLDNMFIASLVFDILRGMIHLHDSEIRIHGRLKSSNCVVDSRWVLKITDYGLTSFIGGSDVAATSEHTHYQGLLSTAPEILRNPSQFPKGSQKGDIYSFAIVLYEIMSRSSPYEDVKLTPKEIVIRLLKNGDDIQLRPKLSALGSTPKFVTDCINDCWQDDPTLRPDFKTVRRRLKGLQKGMKPNIFDNMMAIMEKYATNLESIVDERTDQLREEKKKTEELLHQMLPCSVAEQLKQGKRVEAEAFDCVTIYFSDICGFTALSSESSPMQIVDLLNDLYTTFDSIIENYDVYKVETIGDAYMVVSGLPKLNGQQHAGEIASMSLHLLNAINKFKLRHRPHDALKLRIGIHSGPCVAGVVGLKMPRYCLFGDTVNTASRMESNGTALKIHCSQECKALLDELGGYQVEERGLVAMKGKGELLTYWVVGEDPARRMKRLALPRPTPKTHHMSRSLLKPSIALHKIPSLPALRTDDIMFDGYSPDCHDSGCGPTYNSSKVPNGVNFPDMEGSKENLASDVWRCDHELTRKSHKPSSSKWGGSSKINFEDETNPKLTKLHDASRRNPQWHSTKECSSNKDSRRNHEGLPLLQRSGSAIDNRYSDLLPNGCDAVC